MDSQEIWTLPESEETREMVLCLLRRLFLMLPPLQDSSTAVAFARGAAVIGTLEEEGEECL